MNHVDVFNKTSGISLPKLTFFKYNYFIISKGIFIVCWIIFVVLAYKVSTIEIEHKGISIIRVFHRKQSF